MGLILMLGIAAAIAMYAAKAGAKTSGSNFVDNVINDLPNASDEDIAAAAEEADAQGKPLTAEALEHVIRGRSGILIRYEPLPQNLEEEIKQYIDNYVREKQEDSEELIKGAVVEYFGEGAGPVVDEIFESEWWGDIQDWLAKAHAKVVSEVADAGKDAWDWFEDQVSGIPIVVDDPAINDPDFNIPPQAFRNYIARSSRQLPHLVSSVSSRLGHYVGRDINVCGEPCQITLSGLVAITERAGKRGAKRWLERDSDRIDYPATTRAFRDANGVF